MFKFKIISGLYKNLIFSKNTNFNIDPINVNMFNQIKYKSGQNVSLQMVSWSYLAIIHKYFFSQDNYCIFAQ